MPYLLVITAASLGFIHTLLGPDHYLPFVAIAKARQWSWVKTTRITIICGIAHVGSSVALGFLGIALGIAVSKLEGVESFRGNIAGWLLIAFGLVYAIWGIRRAIRHVPHTHFHTHSDGTTHLHEHHHQEEHLHVHPKKSFRELTPWILFTIFVFGPCEPLIPLLMYPAAEGNMAEVILVSSVFGIVTIATMITLVLALSFGLKLVPLKRLERYSHALAGLALLLCGVSIQFLGL